MINGGEITDELEEGDTLMSDNVQSFINMGILQAKYNTGGRVSFEVPPKIVMKNGVSKKKLLLLDMDETMLHAATLNDIYVQEVYGKEAEPSFITSFIDHDQTIDIGVFLRPFLFDLLAKVSPFFDICVFTASEKVYADAILNQVDPLRKLFTERIYREHCLKAALPPEKRQQHSRVSSDEEQFPTPFERTIYVKDMRAFAHERVFQPGTTE